MKAVEKRKKEFIKNISQKIDDKNILDAFKHVDQQIFFDSIFADKFYGKDQIPIGHKEISDDFLFLAEMINLLKPQQNERIMEIGTGSGYSTAVLSLLCKEVVTFEINEDLAVKAKNSLYKNNFENIRFFNGDATENDISCGEIDGIIIHAACIKRPFTLLDYLSENGKMVFPMGPDHLQQIVCVEKRYNEKNDEPFTTKYYSYGHFSKIKGPYGYDVLVTPEIGERVYVGKTIDSEDNQEAKKSQKGIEKIKNIFRKKK